METRGLGQTLGCRLPPGRKYVTLGKAVLFHLVGVIPGDELGWELLASSIPRSWRNECLIPEGEIWAHTVESTTFQGY